jgi:hypothetical protein
MRGQTIALGNYPVRYAMRNFKVRVIRRFTLGRNGGERGAATVDPSIGGTSASITASNQWHRTAVAEKGATA